METGILIKRGSDSLKFEDIFSKTKQYIVLLTGHKSCNTCLERELNRIDVNTIKNLIVVCPFALEEEMIYYWRKNGLYYPLYIADIDKMGFDESLLNQPSYFVLNNDLKIKDFVQTFKYDGLEFINDYLEYQQRQIE